MGKIILKDSDLTSATPLGGNIDVDRYRFCIEDAQESALEEILGTELLAKMVSDFPVFASDYDVLYGYIRKYLIHQSAVEYMLIGAYQVANSGIFKTTPVNGQPTDKVDNDFIVKNQKYKADMYRGRLEKYLCKHSALFPEYKCSTTNDVNPARDTGQSYDFV